MQTIIDFLEQYWGVTVVGGVTIGTLVTFIIMQVKSLLEGKSLKSGYSTALNIITDITERLNIVEAERKILEQERLNLISANNETENKHRAELKARGDYYAKVQATTFQAISYLVLASKLPNEDKIALQKEFLELGKATIEEVKTTAVDVVKEVINDTSIEEDVVPEVKTIVDDTVTKTQTLLDKYTKGE